MEGHLPTLYTYEEFRTLGQTNSIPDWDTMDIRKLAMILWKSGIITQEMLDARLVSLIQTMYG